MARPNHAKPGCFSDFFQLVFCAENGNSSPMHHIAKPKPYATEVVHGHSHNKDATKPGVVARLMGLDSLPSTNLVSNTTPNSVPRSRSLNFVDYLLKVDTTSQVKTTSASFREVPSLFQHKNKNHDLIVFYWDSESEDQEVVSFLRKQEVGLGESRQRKKQGSKNKEIANVTKEKNHTKRKKISKFENDETRVVVPLKHSSNVRNHNEAKVLAQVSKCSKSCSSNSRRGGSGPSSGLRSNSNLPNKQKKKVLSEPKQHEKKTKKQQQSAKKIEKGCSSENFSPISVLDDYDYSFLYGPDFPDYTSPLMPKTKGEFSEKLYLSDNVGDKRYSYPDINMKEESLQEIMVKLRNLTQNEMRESDFTPKSMCESESYRDICLEYEHRIFDILLHEVVDELVELSC